MTAWRMVKGKHAPHAFDGEGARLFGGRWNSKGVPVVYTAQSQSLAAIELLTHLQTSELLDRYVVIPVTIDDPLIESVAVKRLPRNWRRFPPPARLRLIGDEWVASHRSAVLQVPSVVVPLESNFLLNPAHPDFKRIRIGKARAFHLDPRLVSRR